MNEVLENIKTRRSCRRYSKEQVKEAELTAVLEAGAYAPTAKGLQAPYIVAVQNEADRRQLAAMNAKVMGVETNPYYDAPTYVLVFAPDGGRNSLQDGSCVLENMMLAAHAVGLASCWINREIEMFATPEGKALMAKWGLPEGLMGVGALSLGYADGPMKEPKPRKEGYYRIV